MATRAAAGPGDGAETHAGGVSALLPAAPRQSRGADRAGVVRGRDAGRFRIGVERLVGVLDAHGASHRSDWDRVAEHRPEPRTCSCPDWAPRARTPTPVGRRVLPA